MTRTFVTKSGDTWEWEETKEVVEAIQNYWNTVKQNEQQTTNT